MSDERLTMNYYQEGGSILMVVMTKKKGESKDAFFRKFTKMYIDENIADDVRNKQFYKKPSLARKEKEKLRAQKKHRRAL